MPKTASNFGKEKRSIHLELDAKLVRGGSQVNLDISGEQITVRAEKKRAADEKAKQEEWHRLVVNLEDVSFMDSTGMGLLVMAYQESKRMKRQLGILRPIGEVKTALEYCAIHTLIPIYGTEKDAVADLDLVYSEAV